MQSVFGKINYGGLKHNSLYTWDWYCHLVSISPTFYEQLLRQNPFAKKLQTKIVSTLNLYGMTVNFTNILQAAFSYQSSLRTFYVLTMLVKLTPGG